MDLDMNKKSDSSRSKYLTSVTPWMYCDVPRPTAATHQNWLELQPLGTILIYWIKILDGKPSSLLWCMITSEVTASRWYWELPLPASIAGKGTDKCLSLSQCQPKFSMFLEINTTFWETLCQCPHFQCWQHLEKHHSKVYIFNVDNILRNTVLDQKLSKFLTTVCVTSWLTKHKHIYS